MYLVASLLQGLTKYTGTFKGNLLETGSNFHKKNSKPETADSGIREGWGVGKYPESNLPFLHRDTGKQVF